MILLKRNIFIALFVALLAMACKHEYSPKPEGYFRIDFPIKKYLKTDLNLPYNFEYPAYSKLVPDNSQFSEPYWMNILIPEFKSTIHLSYKPVKNNLAQLTEDSRELAYKHAVKANAINEKLYINNEKRVFGTIYEIKGNVASTLQFHLTDSTKNFIRGSFYISELPNYDSLSPVIHYIDEDIHHLIETFSWN